MSHTKHLVRKLATLGALAAALFLPRAGGTQTVDDTFLLQTSVAPNVILIFDNSYAMNQIEWHPQFGTGSVVVTCNFFNDTTDYVYTGGANVSESHCGQTRTIYVPNNPTLWNGAYLNWYFSLSPILHSTILNEIQNATASPAGCNTAGSATRYISRYRRTRADAARQVLWDVLCLSEPKGLRLGLGLFRDPAEATASPKVDPNGGYLAARVDTLNNNRADLEAHIGNTKIDEGGTPLAEAVFQFYTYLMSRVDANIPFGKDGTTRFPKYIYNKNGDDSSAAGGPLPDPMQYGCQKNYMILVTGGLSTRDDFDRDPVSTSVGYNNFDALIGDYYAEDRPPTPNPDDEYARPNEGTLFLDDIVKYMQDRDMRPDFAGDQTIDFYTVGYMTTDTENAYLRRVATVGDGLFFSAKDGQGLSQSLVDTLNDIVERSRSFTAATVPSSRTADGSDFYNSFFLPSDNSAFWEGHVRAWKFSAAGEIQDRDSHCALDDPDGASQCNNGPFKVICQTGQTWPACVNPYWDAGDVLVKDFVPGALNPTTSIAAPNTPRTLYTSKLNGGSPNVPVRTNFDLPTLNYTDMKLQTFTAVFPPYQGHPNSDKYPLKGSTASNADGLADEIIAYVRGCFFGTGVSAGVSTPKACEERTWMLGDIFHSDPIVVRNPPDRNFGTAYQGFRAENAYGDRDRVIYTGTNGGFLEGFHAGTWNSSTQKYSAGTGRELFGFMPWEARINIKSLPIDSPTSRRHYVDGAPQVSDAWLYTTATSNTKTESEWRTLLVGGMREGGREYYALDVTNPSNDTTPWSGTPIAYPAVQWEFPNEDDYNRSITGTSCSASYPSGSNYPCDYLHMGQTWGQPIITRVKLSISCPGASCATNLERWVAIVTGGYDVTSDPNPTQVDPTAGLYVTSSTCAGNNPTCRGRGIYMIDLKTGKVIAQQRMNFDADGAGGQAAPALSYSLVSTPAVVDYDHDGYADLVYVGDLGGNMWKWVIHDVGKDNVNDGGARSQLASSGAPWKFQKIFSAPVFSGAPSGTDYYKNIFQPPAVAMVNNKLYVSFGTGERAAIGFLDAYADNDDPLDNTADDINDNNGEENRYYVIIDSDPFATGWTTTPPAALTESSLTNITTVGTPVTSPNGYYFKVPNGEKFVTTSVVFAGKVITASFTPSDPWATGGDRCTSRGTGNLYRFDLATGVGAYRDASNNETRYKNIGSGLPTDPKISIGVGGKDNKIVVQQSGTETWVGQEDDVNFGKGIIYWRELH